LLHNSCHWASSLLRPKRSARNFTQTDSFLAWTKRSCSGASVDLWSVRGQTYQAVKTTRTTQGVKLVRQSTEKPAAKSEPDSDMWQPDHETETKILLPKPFVGLKTAGQSSQHHKTGFWHRQMIDRHGNSSSGQSKWHWRNVDFASKSDKVAQPGQLKDYMDFLAVFNITGVQSCSQTCVHSSERRHW
jgi:hypothetical protein